MFYIGSVRASLNIKGPRHVKLFLLKLQFPYLQFWSLQAWCWLVVLTPLDLLTSSLVCQAGKLRAQS